MTIEEPKRALDLASPGENQDSERETALEPVPSEDKRERLPRALRKMRSLLWVTNHLLNFLSVVEREQHRSKLLEVLIPILQAHLAEVEPEQFRVEMARKIEALRDAWDVQSALENCLRDVENHAVQNYKKERNAKPRNVERDAEIVRLRNVEGKSFSHIGKALQAKNPAWVDPDGKPLKRDTVEKAYRRAKERQLPESE